MDKALAGAPPNQVEEFANNMEANCGDVSPLDLPRRRKP